VIEEFGMYTVEVTFCKKIGIKDRGAKGNVLMGKDKSIEQLGEEKVSIF
jgi:hypothetical protein